MVPLAQTLNLDFPRFIGLERRTYRHEFNPCVVYRELDQFKNDLASLQLFLKKKYKVDFGFNRDKSCTSFIISGMYDYDTNRVEVYANCKVKFDTYRFSKKTWHLFKSDVIQTVMHELIHMRQYKSREHDCSVVYDYKKTQNQQKNEDLEYYNTIDEIVAHAHCIFFEMADRGVKQIQSSEDFNVSLTFQNISEVFDNDFTQPALQRLVHTIHRWFTKYQAHLA